MPAKREPVSFLATTTPSETLAFYRDVIGLELIEDSFFALVFRDDGHMLRIQKVVDHTPPEHTAYGWSVADIAAEIARLAQQGCKFSVFSYLSQADNGVWTAPNGDQVAWFGDPAGNNLSLTQFAHESTVSA